MPVSPEARELANMAFLDSSQFGIVLPQGSGVLLPIDQTNMWFLTDIIPTIHFGGVYSAGDILIVMGFILFLPEIIFNKRRIVQSDPVTCTADEAGKDIGLIEQSTSFPNSL